jgi:HEAT repeat protein
MLRPILAALLVNCCVAVAAEDARGPVAALLDELKKGDAQKIVACQKLEELGPKAAEAASALVGLFATKNEDVRLHAALALGKIGGPAVAPLTTALVDKDTDVRFYAAWGLAFVGPPAKTATLPLVKALGDSSAQVRRKAAYALGRVDAGAETTASALIALLGDKEADVRDAARAALPSLGEAAVPVLLRALAKAELRNQAIETLGEIGAGAKSAIPELKKYLLDATTAPHAANALAGIGAEAIPELTAAAANPNINIRTLAVGALHKIGVPAVPAIVDLLGAKDVDVRRQAAAILGGIPVNDKMVVVGLGYAAAKDTDFQVRQSALHALQSRGPGAKLAEPYVSGMLTDIDPEIRKTAFHVLQGLGVDPRPGLKKALTHTDPAIRINTASLMASLSIEIPLAEPVLVEGLKEKDIALKAQAAHALSLRGLKADAVVPIFLEGLKSDVASVRRQSAEALGRYGAQARVAAPALTAALDDADDSVSGQAMTSLRMVGAEPKALLAAATKILRRTDTKQHPGAAQLVFQVGPTAVPEIIGMLKEENAPALRLACLQTLAMVGPPAKDAVDELIKTLADPSPRIRMTAARALGNLGPDAKSAADALAKTAKDADANVRTIAQAALAQIRGDLVVGDFQVQGVLTTSDPIDRVRTGSHHVVHSYPMKAGRTYTIDLTSPWDNFLRLEDPQGNQVAMDDDSGGNLNARIVYRSNQDGWYRIIVTSFAAGASGNYTLKVR